MCVPLGQEVQGRGLVGLVRLWPLRDQLFEEVLQTVTRDAVIGHVQERRHGGHLLHRRQELFGKSGVRLSFTHKRKKAFYKSVFLLKPRQKLLIKEV